MGKRKYMTKAEAIRDFRDRFYRLLVTKDIPAKRQAWNDYTDMLCKDGLISQKKAANWHQPKFVQR
jgi:hypothetical protein